MLRLLRAYPHGAEIWVLGDSGVYILRLGPRSEPGQLQFTPDISGAAPKAKQRWRTALVDVTTCADCTPGRVSGLYYPMLLPHATAPSLDEPQRAP